MEKTNEQIVTNLLSDREILQYIADYGFNGDGSMQYSSNPSYDLTSFMKTKIPEYSRFGNKYIFVK